MIYYPIFKTENIQDYNKLSDREAFQRLNDTLISMQPQLIEALKNAETKVIGEVLQADLSYITYEIAFKINDQTVKQEVVQKLKQRGGPKGLDTDLNFLSE